MFFLECLYFSDHDLTLLLAHSQMLNALDLTKSMRITGSCLSRITGPLTNLSLDRCSSIIPQNLIAVSILLCIISVSIICFIIVVCEFYLKNNCQIVMIRTNTVKGKLFFVFVIKENIRCYLLKLKQ